MQCNNLDERINNPPVDYIGCAECICNDFIHNECNNFGHGSLREHAHQRVGAF